MKYVFQFGLIMTFCFAGELLYRFLPFPIPASIYGLLLLLLCLKLGIVKLSQVKTTGNYLVAILPIMFVPAAVGVMLLWDELASMIVPVFLAAVPVTILVLGTSGRVTQWLISKREE